jgi:hypothetical protein
MKPLLKITTKPIKIAVKIEKGRYVVNDSIKDQPVLRQSPPISSYRKIESIQTKDRISVSRDIDTARFEPVYSVSANAITDQGMDPLVEVSRMMPFESSLPSMAYISHRAEPSSFEPVSAAMARIHDEGSNANVEYQFGSITFSVEQYNEIDFEYTGAPCYVPASKTPESTE